MISETANAIGPLPLADAPDPYRRRGRPALTPIARMLAIGTIALALIALGSGMWLRTAMPAVAPEPARLGQDLSGGTGSTAPAVYVSTQVQTSVIKWPGSFT